MEKPVDMKLLTILQLCDTAFPTGGFSHSVGFETAEKHGMVKTTEDYQHFIVACLENAGSQLLPFVVASHREYRNMDKLVELDGICEVCLNNHVANRASGRQGRSLINTSFKTFQNDVQIVPKLEASISNCEIKGHFAVMYGALCADLEIELDSTLYMFMFTTLKTITASSVRLGRVGPLQAQKVQHELQKIIPDIINRSDTLTVEDVHLRFPLVDTIQNTHDTLFSKLFYS